MKLTKNDNLVKLVQVLNDNPDKAKEFYNLGSSRELYDYCISLVPGYEFDEFVEFMENIAKAASAKKDLTSSELGEVSGGISFEEKINLTKDVIESTMESKSKTDAFLKKIVSIMGLDE